MAHGKITKRDVAGHRLSEGWAIDEAGDSVRDAEAFEKGMGALLPLGGFTAGYKGFGLAMVAELFAGIIGDETVTGQEAEDHVNNAACFILIDPSRFSTPTENRARIEALAVWIDSTDYLAGIPAGAGTKRDRARLPGAIEHEIRQERLSTGIPLNTGTRNLLASIAREHDVKNAIPWL